MEQEARLILLLALLLGCAVPLSFSAGHPFQREKQVSLLPKDTLVHLGVSVQFNCSMPCLNAIFTWKGLDTKSGHVTSTPQYSLLYIASTAPHNEGSIICEATCRGRREQRTSRLRLYSLPDTMQVTLHPERGSGQPAHLVCSIRRVYPFDALTLSWYRGEERLETLEQQTTSSEEDEMDEVQSYRLRLDLPGREAMEGAEYRCEAELNLGEATIWRNKTLNFSAYNGHAVDPTSVPGEDCSACGTVTVSSNPTIEPVTSTVYPTSETSTTRKEATVQAKPNTEAVKTSVNPTNETVTKLNHIAERARKGSLRTETVTYRWKPTQLTPTATLNPSTETVLYRKNPVNVTPTATLNPRTETVLYRRNPVNETPTATLNPRTETLTYGASPTNTMVMFTKNPTNVTLTLRVTPINEAVALRDNPTAVNSTTRGKPRTETLTTRIPFTTETAVAKGVDGTEDPKRKITVASRRPNLGTLSTGMTDSITKRRGYFGTKHTATPEDNTAPPISSNSHSTERVPPKRDQELTAEDDNTNLRGQSPPPEHGLSGADSLDSDDYEQEAGPSGMPGRNRSQDTTATPTPSATTITTTTLSPAGTTPVATTTTAGCNTRPATEDVHPTTTTAEARGSRHVQTVVSQQAHDSRAGARPRDTWREQHHGTEALANITRVIEAYEQVQGQTDQAHQDARELQQVLRSMDHRMGQIVDLLGQLVAELRIRPAAQTTAPPPSGLPQDASSPSSPADTERGESSDTTGPAAVCPPAKKPRGQPKKSLGPSRGKAPAKRHPRGQP